MHSIRHEFGFRYFTTFSRFFSYQSKVNAQKIASLRPKKGKSVFVTSNCYGCSPPIRHWFEIGFLKKSNCNATDVLCHLKSPVCSCFKFCTRSSRSLLVLNTVLIESPTLPLKEAVPFLAESYDCYFRCAPLSLK